MLSEDEKAIQFYKRFIETEEQELEWMYKEDEEYYRDSIEQKELLIKGWRNILNLINKLQKENELAKEQLKKQCKIADERNDLLVKINKLEKENDLMVEEIRKTILIVKSESRFCQYENDCKNIRCKDCIKQYYEKLAKEKGE